MSRNRKKKKKSQMKEWKNERIRKETLWKYKFKVKYKANIRDSGGRQCVCVTNTREKA